MYPMLLDSAQVSWLVGPPRTVGHHPQSSDSIISPIRRSLSIISICAGGNQTCSKDIRTAVPIISGSLAFSLHCRMTIGPWHQMQISTSFDQAANFIVFSPTIDDNSNGPGNLVTFVQWTYFFRGEGHAHER